METISKVEQPKRGVFRFISEAFRKTLEQSRLNTIGGLIYQIPMTPQEDYTVRHRLTVAKVSKTDANTLVSITTLSND
ncbi:MAG: hypothetical protein AAB914_01260, partial [Patescibacteria group bacterium]